jgi:hypothetical protein
MYVYDAHVSYVASIDRHHGLSLQTLGSRSPPASKPRRYHVSLARLGQRHLSTQVLDISRRGLSLNRNGTRSGTEAVSSTASKLRYMVEVPP